MEWSEFQRETKENEEKANRRLLRMSGIVGAVEVLTYVLLLLVAVYAVSSLGWQIALIAAGFLHLILGVAVALYLEYKSGYYECPECGARYVPKISAFILSPHMGFRRKLTCPKCGTRKYHKKVMTKE